MDKKTLLKTLLLSVVVVLISSCSKKDEWFDSVPNGKPFVRANTVRFYYVDKEGKGLINPETLSLPINIKETETTIPDSPSDLNPTTGFYNNGLDYVKYDNDKKMYYYSTLVLGNSNLSKYTFYVYFNGDVDKMDMRYKYTNKDIIGADYYAKITSWSFNGEHFYSDEQNQNLKVFVKKADGKTTLSFE